MHAKQNRCRSTWGPISRGKDFPHGPVSEKNRPSMSSKHKPTCCACTQLQAGPGNLLTPAQLIKTGRSNQDGHTCQTRTPIHYAPWQQQRKRGEQGHGSAPPPQAGEAAASSPLAARHAPSTAKRPEAIEVVTWRTDPRERGQCKEVLVGKGGRVPLLVPLLGRP